MMKRIYTKNNYLIIEWSGSSPLMRPKKNIFFYRADNDPNKYFITDNQKSVPVAIQTVMWSDFVKEDGTHFTSINEFNDWITANTGNFNAGSDSGEFEPLNYDLAEFNNESYDPFIKKSQKPKDGAKGEKGERGEQGIQGIQGLKGDKGDMGATGAQGIQGLPGINSIGFPTLRAGIAKSTAYQALNPTKPAIITITLNATSNATLTIATNNAANIIIGPTNAVATGTGTIVGKYNNTLSVGVLISTGIANTYTINLPAGYFFAILNANNTTGVTIDSVVDQQVG